MKHAIGTPDRGVWRAIAGARCWVVDGYIVWATKWLVGEFDLVWTAAK